MGYKSLKPCPFCGSDEITYHAFSIDPDCYIECACGAGFSASVPWGGLNEEDHDIECAKVLSAMWNRRTPYEGD